MFAWKALKHTAFHEYERELCTKIERRSIGCHCTPIHGTFLLVLVYKRLRISSTTSVVLAVPPKSGLRSLPSSKFPSTAA
jgi:hypothetical protein